MNNTVYCAPSCIAIRCLNNGFGVKSVEPRLRTTEARDWQSDKNCITHLKHFYGDFDGNMEKYKSFKLHVWEIPLRQAYPKSG